MGMVASGWHGALHSSTGAARQESPTDDGGQETAREAAGGSLPAWLVCHTQCFTRPWTGGHGGTLPLRNGGCKPCRDMLGGLNYTPSSLFHRRRP